MMSWLLVIIYKLWNYFLCENNLSFIKLLSVFCGLPRVMGIYLLERQVPVEPIKMVILKAEAPNKIPFTIYSINCIRMRAEIEIYISHNLL